MSLRLENELHLRAAQISASRYSEAELLVALNYAWGQLLLEREAHERLASDLTGVPVTISGPLLPPSLRFRAAVGG